MVLFLALYEGIRQKGRKNGVNEGESFRFDLWLYNEMCKREWNVLDLAIESGVSEKSIYEYARGTRLPTLRNFHLLLQALGKHIEIVDN